MRIIQLFLMTAPLCFLLLHCDGGTGIFSERMPYYLLKPDLHTSFFPSDLCTLTMSMAAGGEPIANGTFGFEISYDNAGSFAAIAPTRLPSGNKWIWPVTSASDPAFVTSEQCYIRFYMVGNTNIDPKFKYELSNRFSIRSFPQGDTQHTLRVMYPNGGEIYYPTDSLRIRIRLTPDTANIKIHSLIYLSLDSGSVWSVLDTALAPIFLTQQDTYLKCKLPDTSSTRCLLKVADTALPNQYVDQSDHCFELRSY
jgi:hypothetical protein